MIEENDQKCRHATERRILLASEDVGRNSRPATSLPYGVPRQGAAHLQFQQPRNAADNRSVHGSTWHDSAVQQYTDTWLPHQDQMPDIRRSGKARQRERARERDFSVVTCIQSASPEHPLRRITATTSRSLILHSNSPHPPHLVELGYLLHK